MKGKHIATLLVLMIFIWFSQVHGQMVGNPAGVRGQGEWTLSALGAYVDHEEFESKRILLKSSLGVLPWIDLFALGGAAQLDLSLPHMDPFKGAYEFAYGLGVTISTRPMSDQPLEIWGGIQGLRFPSRGSYIDPSRNLEFEMVYDWKEYQGYLGVTYRIGIVRLYMGGIGWGVQREDKRTSVYALDKWGERLYTTNDPQIESTYQSGLWTGGFLGIEIILPMRYSINVEVVGFNEENYQIRVGVCQTGLQPW
jgi:hypothetical protein